MNKNHTDYRILIIDHGKISLVNMVGELHIIFVVDGSCKIVSGDEKTMIEKSDILLVNPSESRCVEVLAGSLIALISIDYFALCNALGKDQIRFYLNSREDAGQKYTAIRSLLQDFLLAHVGHGFSSPYQELGCYYLFLQTLADSFAIKPNPAEVKNYEDPRIVTILRYIHTNYKTDVSLKSIAEQLYLSVSSASRLFHRATGDTFPAYIKKLRLRHVQIDLEYADSCYKSGH